MATRRAFMKGGAMAVVGTAAIPSFLTRAAWGAVAPGASNKRLVVIFQRGAADGLNIVVPFGEPNYYRLRPTIAIGAAGLWVTAALLGFSEVGSLTGMAEHAAPSVSVADD